MGISGTESLVHRAFHKRRLSCIPVLNQIKKVSPCWKEVSTILKPKTSFSIFLYEKKNHEYTYMHVSYSEVALNADAAINFKMKITLSKTKWLKSIIYLYGEKLYREARFNKKKWLIVKKNLKDRLHIILIVLIIINHH